MRLAKWKEKAPVPKNTAKKLIISPSSTIASSSSSRDLRRSPLAHVENEALRV
jgi:hypothetical protein